HARRPLQQATPTAQLKFNVVLQGKRTCWRSHRGRCARDHCALSWRYRLYRTASRKAGKILWIVMWIVMAPAGHDRVGPPELAAAQECARPVRFGGNVSTPPSVRARAGS